MSAIENRALPASIVVPTYNRETFVTRAIGSALAQTVEAIEVVVVDDGSTDGTAEAIRAIGDERVRLLRHDVNRGKSVSWFAGARAARGRFLMWLSDDDEIAPTFVERRIDALADERLAVAFGGYEVRSADGDLLETRGEPQAEQRLDARGLLRAALSRRWFLGSSLYRTAALFHPRRRVLGAENALDFALNVDLALDGSAGVLLPVADFAYTSHPGQTARGDAWQSTLRQTADYLQAAIADPATPAEFTQVLRRELSNVEVVWARRLVSQHDSRTAAGHFRQAVKADPRNRWAWKQLARSLV